MPPTFVTMLEPFDLIERCNTKLTKKFKTYQRIKSWTKQLHVASYSGSRQGTLQLLKIKTFIQNPPPIFLRQFSMIKRSFDVELGWIREFAMHDKR